MGLSWLEQSLEKERILLVGKEEGWQESIFQGTAGIFCHQEITAMNNGSNMMVANQKQGQAIIKSESQLSQRERITFGTPWSSSDSSVYTENSLQFTGWQHIFLSRWPNNLAPHFFGSTVSFLASCKESSHLFLSCFSLQDKCFCSVLCLSCSFAV